MSKSCIEVVKGNLEVKKDLVVRGDALLEGDLFLQGNLLTSCGQNILQPEPIVLTSPSDLLRAQIVSPFVPIVIAPNASTFQINLNLPALYNREVTILNLSARTFTLLGSNGNTQITRNLPAGSFANVTVIATNQCSTLGNMVYTLIEVIANGLIPLAGSSPFA